jgi:lipopolysaccharide transport system ATP-binding protein
MSDVAIRVEGLSKRYRIGKRHSERTFREALVDAFKTPFGSFGRGGDESEFWALKDVSFEVNRGEVLGIIGRNGAGKSTLLKILSRITDPTSGRAEVFGRVGSLLEVGTGFHPELTGRENVYLNGAILGMKRREIDRQFDEIVDFAEVEKFIDTPVKHYSSGMYVRLAFAVAAHLEPEILIVDEVLAVGDVAFQARCIAHFQKMVSCGKTVVLISHNMAVVRQVCGSALLLSQGELAQKGSPSEVVEFYSLLQPLSSYLTDEHVDLQRQDPLRWGNGAVRMIDVYTRSAGSNSRVFGRGEPVEVVIEFEAVESVEEAVIGIVINNSAGQPIFATNSVEAGVNVPPLIEENRYRAIFEIDNVFGDGSYSISGAINNRDRNKPFCRVENVRDFEVNGNSGRSAVWPHHSLRIDLLQQ